MKDLERELRTGIDQQGAARAAQRFVDRAERLGLVDVAYSSVDSPLGPLLVAATEGGLVRVSFAGEPRDEVLEELSLRISPRVLELPSRLDAVRRELDEYFEHRRKLFSIPVDLRLVKSDFRRRVLKFAQDIPYGNVATYREVATGAGNARAVRAAGSALGSNPVPIVVPCHRVLRTDGSLGGYGGGLERKVQLLQLEGRA